MNKVEREYFFNGNWNLRVDKMTRCELEHIRETLLRSYRGAIYFEITDSTFCRINQSVVHYLLSLHGVKKNFETCSYSFPVNPLISAINNIIGFSDEDYIKKLDSQLGWDNTWSQQMIEASKFFNDALNEAIKPPLPEPLQCAPDMKELDEKLDAIIMDGYNTDFNYHDKCREQISDSQLKIIEYKVKFYLKARSDNEFVKNIIKAHKNSESICYVCAYNALKKEKIIK